MRLDPRLLALGFVWLAVPVSAQERAAPLGGPEIRDTEPRRSLVERDFAGKLKRPEVPPEEAALALLSLDRDTRSRINGVLAERAKILDEIVIDNLEEVVKLYNARLANDRRDQILLLTDLMRKLQPLNARGTLASEIRAELPTQKAREFDALLEEYRKAAIEDQMAAARANGERMAQRQAEVRENLQTLGVEIKRSYERQITSKTAEFEEIIAQLDLKPEQETKIRNLVSDFAQQTRGRPTPEQKQNLFFSIMSHLDARQQQKLVGIYLGR